MNVYAEDIQQRLGFIERTIYHALRACHADSKVSEELMDYVHQLGQRSGEVQRALQSDDENSIRQTVDDLARLSDKAQNTIAPSDEMAYDVKSAVILTHIELSALRLQLD